ncbi:hypothetical protein GGR57DRAFT_516300 [Xylariaceae sp. FL1272]|nr:hypothetical protein GGR57DRAFT_516300 [Xylariaceae sp. FL1272]
MSSPSNQDLMLFTTGRGSDVTISCNGRRWRLHHFILTSRNEWFRARLTGPDTSFEQEMEGAVLYIPDQDPDAVHQILEWIYTTDVEATPSAPRNLSLTFNTQLCLSARFFNFHRAFWACFTRLQVSLKGLSCEFQGLSRRRPLSNAHINDIIAAADVAYHRSNIAPLRSVFKLFLVDCHFYIVTDPGFATQARRVPAFWLDAIEGFLDAFSNGRTISVERCNTCAATPQQQ